MDLENAERITKMEAKIETLEQDLVAMNTKITKLAEDFKGLRMLILVNIAVSVVFGIAKMVMASHGAAPASASGNSVQIGAAVPAAAVEMTARDYLKTDEVADREGVSPRTVISMVERGEFSPAPVKDGREWRFARDYRVKCEVASEQ